MTVEPARAAIGDRPGEQLLDRPVDHRQDHEHDRPAQRDTAVGGGIQYVAGGGQVEEREDAGRGEADRQPPGAGGEGRFRRLGTAAVLIVSYRARARRRLGRRRRGRSGGHQDTRTSSIVHGNGERAWTTSPWRATP